MGSRDSGCGIGCVGKAVDADLTGAVCPEYAGLEVDVTLAGALAEFSAFERALRSSLSERSPRSSSKSISNSAEGFWPVKHLVVIVRRDEDVKLRDMY